MRKTQFVLLAIVLAWLIADCVANAAADSKRPNIIVFLVDDMGWTDCGALWQHLLRNAEHGSTGEAWHAIHRCVFGESALLSHAASILTGKYPARHGITTPSGHEPPQPPGYAFLADTAPPNQEFVYPESKHYLEPSEYTIAERLRDAGLPHRTFWQMASGADRATLAGKARIRHCISRQARPWPAELFLTLRLQVSIVPRWSDRRIHHGPADRRGFEIHRVAEGEALPAAYVAIRSAWSVGT